MQERDKFDSMICTGFVRIYPTAGQKKKLYARMMEQSQINFNEFANGPRLPNSKPGTFGTETRGMARTIPPPQKSKAADLNGRSPNKQPGSIKANMSPQMTS